MIESIGQVMLYVNDVSQAVTFWQEQVGFKRVVALPQQNGAYLISPKLDSEVSFVLHDKQKVAQLDPTAVLATPAILFSTKDLAKTWQKLKDTGVKVSPITQMGPLKVFNFCDLEENYFAVQEIQ